MRDGKANVRRFIYHAFPFVLSFLFFSSRNTRFILTLNDLLTSGDLRKIDWFFFSFSLDFQAESTLEQKKKKNILGTFFLTMDYPTSKDASVQEN